MAFDKDAFIQDAEDHIIHCYNRYPIVFDHGEDVYLYDKEGRKYLDFVAGISVNALGYGDEGLSQVIADQAKKLMHCSNLYWNEPAANAARRITKATGMDKVFFGNSGTEAVEGALKLARIHQKKNKGENAVDIISMNDSFHGRTYAATTASGQDHFHENLEPLPGGFKYVPFNDIDALKAAVDDNTAAIILEPVQGEGGIVPADADYLKAVRKLADDNNVLLIFDEVQCGAGRTGKFLAAHNYGVKPDIVCMAKGIGAGFPIGAFLTTSEIAESLAPGTHGSTYGGNPLACAVSDYVLSVTTTDEFLKGVEENGNYLLEKLAELQKDYPDLIAQTRGLGLIDGMVLTDKLDAGQFVKDCMDEGLLLITAANNVIRVVPPLIVTKDHIDDAVAIMKKVLDGEEKKLNQ